MLVDFLVRLCVPKKYSKVFYELDTAQQCIQGVSNLAHDRAIEDIKSGDIVCALNWMELGGWYRGVILRE